MHRPLAFGTFFLLLVSLAPAAQAQSDDDDMGYVDPRVVEEWFDEPPTVEVNLRGALLRMAAQTTSDTADGNDSGMGRLLDRISAIHVRIFEPENAPAGDLEARATELTERLGRDGWETIVRAREPEEQVSVQLRSRSEDTIAGLVVLVNEVGGESVFVNIVGDLSPAELGQLTGSIDGLDGLGDLGNASPSDNENSRDAEKNQ